VNQLSLKTVQRFTVVPNIQHYKTEEVRESFLNFIPEKTTVWIKDFAMGSGRRIDKSFQKAVEAFNALPESPVKHSDPAELYLDEKITKNK
jgi:transcription-repair coupling factor (superfamily II helicase)